MTLSISVSDLPHSLRDVAETLGLDVALKLIGSFGGQEIKFPKRPHDGHPVIAALGKDAGYALCEFMSGGMIYVPHTRSRRSIRLDVLALEKSGKERGEIARILGVSQRHVRRMANRPGNPDQFDLFA
ncbi:hypothetical protein GOZ89_23805 [Agrobacterium vitis]|uniref:helix-turn-helix domain-containing protein n=1 Tax=Agrobacterium vitis TaxID=373 RepID=UPI0012E793AE|nr:helix-turn-helix domain-containing protein [Agrobacterium vitis]MVA82441.1 hypothetical protein [Agrobacterium vitis]BCH58537.1 hypothetical protein RvVAR0630_11610 [Agrobacterium vitis]BCH63700.1 hypothetical protein RvVAT039_09160 [Agrobacterium vitis]